MWAVKVIFSQPRSGSREGYLSTVRVLSTGIEPSFSRTVAGAMMFISQEIAGDTAMRLLRDPLMHFEIVKRS